jgi:hypothetical protein
VSFLRNLINQVLQKFPFSPQKAEVSIKFYRGIKSTAATECESTSIEQVKIEFESIKSLISERGSGGGAKVELKDFCMSGSLIFIKSGKFIIN